MSQPKGESPIAFDLGFLALGVLAVTLWLGRRRFRQRGGDLELTDRRLHDALDNRADLVELVESLRQDVVREQLRANSLEEEAGELRWELDGEGAGADVDLSRGGPGLLNPALQPAPGATFADGHAEGFA